NSYPYANYSPYAYPTPLVLNAYPNTLSTNLPTDLFPDFSALAIDPATLPIIPEDVFETPKQPDNSQHDLNPHNAFSYHRPDEEKYGNSNASLNFPTNMSRHFMSQLFTDPLNYQYILPDGRIGELPIVPAIPEDSDYISPQDANKIIYDAKKARGDEVVTDILGREYTPDKVFNLTDSQDYVDESLRGQVEDFLRYNLLDPTTNSDEDIKVVQNLYEDFINDPDLKDSFSGLPADIFISDVLGSNTGLVSPLARAGNPMIDNQPNISNYITQFMQDSTQTPERIIAQPKLSEFNIMNTPIDRLWDSIRQRNTTVDLRNLTQPSKISHNINNVQPLRFTQFDTPEISNTPDTSDTQFNISMQIDLLVDEEEKIFKLIEDQTQILLLIDEGKKTLQGTEDNSKAMLLMDADIKVLKAIEEQKRMAFLIDAEIQALQALQAMQNSIPIIPSKNIQEEIQNQTSAQRVRLLQDILQRNPLSQSNEQPSTSPLLDRFDENFNKFPLNIETPPDNPLAYPFNVSEYNDYTGTERGEWYHMMQYLQESLAEITKVKVPFIGFDGKPVDQQFASPELTGNVPVFDPVSEGYSWMNTSPYYQDYIEQHIEGEHGGIHDVFTPRGFHPSDFFSGGEVFTGETLSPTPVYQSKDFISPINNGHQH
ncbi:MAG: hypothetical protein ACJAQ0_000001, partial [Dasania sp.]